MLQSFIYIVLQNTFQLSTHCSKCEMTSNRLDLWESIKERKQFYNLIYSVDSGYYFYSFFSRITQWIFLPMTFQSELVFKSGFPQNRECNSPTYFTGDIWQFLSSCKSIFPQFIFTSLGRRGIMTFITTIVLI